MRFTGIGIAALLALSGFGCKPPPLDQVEPFFKKALTLHFERLNNEALQRKDELRRGLHLVSTNPAMRQPTGTVYSSFHFDDAAFIVENYACRVCGTTLLLTLPSAKYLCDSCGHRPYLAHRPDANLIQFPCKTCLQVEDKTPITQAGMPKAPSEAEVSAETLRAAGAAVKMMYDLTQKDTKKPLEATVRFVRRQHVFDSRASVMTMEKARARSGWNDEFIPRTDGSGYSRPGFHRTDAEFVGEVTFMFKGGSLIQTSAIRETPVRDWKDLKGIRQ